MNLLFNEKQQSTGSPCNKIDITFSSGMQQQVQLQPTRTFQTQWMQKQQAADVVTAIAAAWWQPQGQTYFKKEATINRRSLHDSSGNMVKIIMQQKCGDSKAPAAEA